MGGMGKRVWDGEIEKDWRDWAGFCHVLFCVAYGTVTAYGWIRR